MAAPLTLLEQRQDEDWLIGFSSKELYEIAHQTLQDLYLWQTTHPSSYSPTLLLSEPDPFCFLAYFTAACSFPCSIVVCNPTWTEAEFQQVIALVTPDLVMGSRELQEITGAGEASQPLAPGLSSHILIPTGGSSGKIRFARHTWETLIASVRGFQQHFQVEQVNSLCVLPLYHVSGLMQFMRSLLTGGKLAIVPFKSLQAGSFPPLPHDHFFLSLVPTQLHRLLTHSLINSPTLLLPQKLTILLGGALAWDELLEKARSLQLPIAPTYGMTETASQIATLRPEEFLQGRSGCGRVLPHARVTIRDEAGNTLPANQVGQVTIAAKSLMLGYFPASERPGEFVTEDYGYLDQEGYLHILGRRDGTIITGGKNVYPAEVESAIWATGLVTDVCVVGLADADWGQMVTAVYVPARSTTQAELQRAIASRLSRYKHPKRWIALQEFPRNAQGKVNYQQVMALLHGHPHSQPTSSR